MAIAIYGRITWLCFIQERLRSDNNGDETMIPVGNDEIMINDSKNEIMINDSNNEIMIIDGNNDQIMVSCDHNHDRPMY